MNFYELRNQAFHSEEFGGFVALEDWLFANGCDQDPNDDIWILGDGWTLRPLYREEDGDTFLLIGYQTALDGVPCLSVFIDSEEMELYKKNNGLSEE